MFKSKVLFILGLMLLIACGYGQTVSSISLSPTSITGGDKVTATVTLKAKAPGTGITVNLVDGSRLTTMPTTLVIPGGQTSATFVIATVPEKIDVRDTIFASFSTGTKSAKLTIKAPVVSTVTVKPTSVTGGATVTGTVTLTGSTANGGLTVNLKSTAPNGVVPPSMSVVGGAAYGYFTIKTQPVTTQTNYTITASTGSTSAKATLTVGVPAMQSLTIAPTSIVGGNHTSGAIVISGAPGKGGVKITLKSSSKFASTLASIVMAQGAGVNATIDITTTAVTAKTQVKITATLGSSSITTPFTIVPIAISGIIITPGKVQGGATATATITLNGKAGTGGFPIKLSSDQPFATLKGSTSVTAGQSSTTVTIGTSKVTVSGVANITASDTAGDSVKGTLTVSPQGSGLASTPWPKFQHDNINTGLGVGSGAVGTVKWKFATQGGVASSAAIGGDGTIYFGANDNNLYAVDGSTGAVKWKYATNSTVDSSPSLSADGTVYFGGWDGSFYALDATTGKLKWFFPINSYVMSGAAIAKDGTVIFGCADDYVYAVDGATGTQKWKVQTGESVVTTPVIGPDGTVYIGSDDEKMYAIDGSTGTVKWTYKTSGSIVSSATLSPDGTLYFGSYDSNLYALDSSTGAKKWVFKLTREIHSSPSIGSNGTIYFGCSDSNVYAVDSAGNQVWKAALDSEFWTSPALGSDGTVYISSNAGMLYALNGSSGATVWKRQLGFGARSSVAIGSDGTLYIGSSDNQFYAIK